MTTPIETRIVTIKKKGNDISIDICGKGFDRVNQLVDKNCELGVKFSHLTDEQKQAIKSAAKEAYQTLDTVKVDFATLKSESIGFVPTAPTGYRSPAMKLEDWKKSQELKEIESKPFDLEYEMYEHKGRYYG
jgi:hypothetical protein